MHGHEAANAVIFGIDPLWMSTAILVLAYVILLSEKVHRTVIALFGAGVAIVTGVLNQTQAIAGIDFNTIALLTGMMIIVGITKTTGVFEFVAIWSAKKVKASPIGILIALSIVTAVFSAFLDNLTTVLLVVPVALLLADKLKLSPYPFLVSQILASNVGGTATLIGDPPNILIGSATGLTFMQFLTTLGPVTAYYFVADPKHDQYAGKLSDEETVRLVIQGCGKSGLCIDYLTNTYAHLEELDIHDEHLARIIRMAQEAAG